MVMTVVPFDAGDLLPSWELHLRAERKADQTVKSYLDGVRRYLAFCSEHDVPADLTRDSVRHFIVHMLDAGAAPSTATSRLLALKRYAGWLVEEGEIQESLIANLKSPKIDRAVIQPLTDEQLKAFLAACKGTAFRDRRDEAILRLMIESGMRAGEVVALKVSDIDLTTSKATVQRGKGGKGRVVPFGAKAAQALDRYLRARRGHALAETSVLWLGDRSNGFSYDGLYVALKYRAGLAGIENFHPHLLRHTAAHRWLAAGGSEGGLMAVAGWTRPDMLLRYTQAQAASRAADESRKLNLGDL